jgi:nucleoid DNA-binding protein
MSIQKVSATRGQNPNKPKRLETIAFIKEIADRMFIPEETVQAVWDTSVNVITESLLKNEKVIIRRFGVFKLSKAGTARFRAAIAMRQLLKESAMEKYGVEMDNETVLMAKVTGECPSCKSPLDSKDPPHCPNCGTTPFEKVDRRSSMTKNFGTIYGAKPNEEE